MTQMCNHGLDGMFCQGCRKEERARIKALITAGTHAYIISAFHEDGNYSLGNAVSCKTYKSQKVAQGVIDRSGANQVVRLVKL